MSNKQRLTLLNRYEKSAARTGGVVDHSIPEEDLRECLKKISTHDFDTEAILSVVAEQAGYCRGFAVPGMKEPKPPAHMQPHEIKAQAEATVAVIDELMARIQHMNPALRAKTDEQLYGAFGSFAHGMIDKIRPDLYRLRAAVQIAGDQIFPSAKSGNRADAHRAIVEAIRQHSYRRTPARSPMANDRAKELAEDLLDQCGL